MKQYHGPTNTVGIVGEVEMTRAPRALRMLLALALGLVLGLSLLGLADLGQPSTDGSTSQAGLAYGVTAKSGWVKSGRSYQYYKQSATGNYEPVKGWQKIGRYHYYFKQVGSRYLMVTGIQKIGRAYYYFKPVGKTDKYAMAQGLQKIGKYYYFFKQVGKTELYAMAHGLQEANDGKTYYFKKNSQGYYSMASGWQKAGTNKYYFKKDSSGRHPAYAGWLKYKGKTYYFDKDGKMAVGWRDIGRSKYTYYDSDTGTWKYRQETYYFDEDGSMAIGWRTLASRVQVPGKHRHYFGVDGKMFRGDKSNGGVLKLNGKMYLMNDYDGRLRKDITALHFRYVPNNGWLRIVKYDDDGKIRFMIKPGDKPYDNRARTLWSRLNARLNDWEDITFTDQNEKDFVELCGYD
ncbi:MAG: hypothetical protein LBH64_01910, partial [Coriobacteriales bacterium]|nr:hypothetical protein [Coriobacteriales bacterium]